MTLLAPRHGIISAIRKLGLVPGLQIVWDAGDDASYPGTGQNFVNLGPAINSDLYLGAGAAVAATDPTFTGVAGRRSDGDYFAMDGGDYFVTQVPPPNNIYNTIHKDNALFTLAGWFYRPAAAGTGRTFATAAGNNTDVGVQWGVNSTPALFFTVFRNNAGGPAFASTITCTWPGNSWAFMATSIDEANNVGIGKVNGETTNFACTYVTPSVVGPNSYPIIGSDYNNSFPAPAGSRYASLCMWEGRALKAEELEALFQATRGKYGV